MGIGRSNPRWNSRWSVLILILAASLPFLLRMDAGLLSEDSSILRYVHGHSFGSDFAQPQFEMHAIRFWRPLVTLSWDLQESLFGAQAAWLRLANLIGILSAGWFARRTVLALGMSRLAAGAAFLFVAWFPFAGGTVVWLAGRTDVFVTALLLAGLSCSLERRHLTAAAIMLAAAATKETGFVLPLWVALFWWARRVSLAEWWRAVWPVAIAAGLGLLLRRAALGVWVGGYPHAPDLGGLARTLPNALHAWLDVAWPTLALVGVLALIGLWQKSLLPRMLLAALGAALVAVGPLVPMLRAGELGLSNARLLEPSCAALSLAVAAAVARRPAASMSARIQLLAIASVLLIQGARTFGDVGRWAANADRSKARFMQLREQVAAAPASELPVLIGELPTEANGLYLFQFGIADQFLPPLTESSHDVWPDRPLFGWDDSQRLANRARLTDSEALAGQARWPKLEVRCAAAMPLVLDESVLDANSVTTEIELVTTVPQPGRLEAVLYTPSGYEVATEFSLTEPRVSLRTLLLARGQRFSLGETWMQAVDLGAEHAYLELRWVGADGPTHVSDWIELTWDESLKGAVARALGYE